MEKVLPDLRKALDAHPKAQAQWADLTPIARRDFTSWIESAKLEKRAHAEWKWRAVSWQQGSVDRAVTR